MGSQQTEETRYICYLRCVFTLLLRSQLWRVVTFKGSLLSGFANNREILSLLWDGRYFRGGGGGGTLLSALYGTVILCQFL